MGEFTANVAAIWWVLPAALGIAVTANTLAMEGAVMFAPAFLLLFPALSGAFPELTPYEAIGVSLLIMFFGTASAGLGYLRSTGQVRGIPHPILAAFHGLRVGPVSAGGDRSQVDHRPYTCRPRRRSVRRNGARQPPVTRRRR